MSVSRGFYRHYKGPIYYVFGVACLKHERDRRVVIYTSVKTEEDTGLFDFLARDERDFESLVTLAYAPDTAQVQVPRFQRVVDPAGSVVPSTKPYL